MDSLGGSPSSWIVSARLPAAQAGSHRQSGSRGCFGATVISLPEIGPSPHQLALVQIGPRRSTGRGLLLGQRVLDQQRE
jgi:hypothetical protein